MITHDVARAHVDELQRIAAAYRRTAVRRPSRRRVIARHARKR
ncbi:MAG: hypothetical protein ACRDP9_15615 [Kribbellaceae bacterium]